MTQQGNRAMTRKNLILAASITMLIAVSGIASARAAGSSYTRNWTVTTGRSDQQVRRAFTTETVEPNAHRYHGGPKSND
jgi:hypothetical protein